MVAVILVSIVRFVQIGGGSVFFAVLVGIFVMLLVFNIVDLLILDWLIFNTLTPRIIVLPGTEGAQGYRDYGFHFRAFLKGVAGSLVGSLLIAGVASVIYAVVS